MAKPKSINQADGAIGKRLEGVEETIRAAKGAQISSGDLSAVLENLKNAAQELNIIHAELRQLNLRQLRLEIGETTSVRVEALIARSIKAMRNECGRTQAQLAADMVRLGFVTWKRITVAETESGKRRPDWEELLGLCVLFGVSLESLIGALTPREVVFLNERRAVTADEYVELIGLPADLVGLSPAELIGVDLVRFQGEAFGLPGDLIAKNAASLYAWSIAVEMAARAGAIVADVDQPFSDEDWRPIAELRRRLRQTRGASQPTQDESP